MVKVLRFGDERALTDNLAPFLQRIGFDVKVAVDGADALSKAPSLAPDLIVSDVLMPRLDGRELLRRLRQGGEWTPVVFHPGGRVDRARSDAGGDMAIARKFGDKVYKWHVPDLQAAAVGLPVQETPTDRFNLDVDAWFGEACAPTIANVVDHMKRVQRVDLSYPILLSAEGHVFDGLHRLAKCLLEGIETITYQQFKVNPEPFEIVDFAVFSQERPLIAETLVWMEMHKL